MDDLPSWAIPAAVLAIGAIVGLLIARDSGSEAERRAVGDRGKREDLESAHTSVLAALKHLEAEKPKLPPEEYEAQRQKLVKQGADILRSLDGDTATEQEDTLAGGALFAPEFLAELEKERTRLGGDSLRAALAEHLGMSASPQVGGMAPEWRGALWTMLGVLLTAGLVLAMQSSVGPRIGDNPMTGRQSPGQTTAGELQKESEEAARLKVTLASDPTNLDALNGLTELAFVDKDLGAAMNWNRQAMEAHPDDLTARTYKGVLRSSVGMQDKALELIDGVLAEDPNFRTALVYKGLIAFDAGLFDQSADALERALTGAPPNPFLQSRLEEAKRMANGGAPVVPDAAPGAPETIVSGTLVLGEGVTVPDNALIFVSVRSPAGGPPLGAVRLSPGPFPMPFEVTAADAISMGGAPRPFPAELVVRFKVDTDGNAMTTEPGAPTASLESVAKGSTELQVTLTP